MTDKPDHNRRRIIRSLAGVGGIASINGASGLANMLGAETLNETGSIDESLEPKYGGRIRVASVSSSTADTLDPAKGALSTDYTRHNMFYNGLTRHDKNLLPELELAETFESSDQILWSIVLHKEVEFHNGQPLTAADVVYSLLRHQDLSVASKMSAVAKQFESIKATGRHTLELKLTGANADLPSILAASHFLIIPEGTKNFDQAIGTGPYKLKEFKPGIRTVGERNTNYWKPGKPYLDEIELIGISDEPSRVNALLSGDVQLISAVNPRSTRRIRKSSDHGLLETKSGLYTDLVMRNDAHPTNNPDFVLAIKHLLDRELIKRALFRGYAEIANDHPVAPSSPFYAADLPIRSYDPEKAKFLLKRAGMSGLRIPVFASPAAASSVDMAALLQLAASKIGLKVGVNRVPADGYWSNHWMKHPLGFGNINPRPTVDLLFSLFYKSDAPWNTSGWNNPQFDQLLVAARGESDQQKRKQMYVDMQVLIHNHCGAGIPVFISLIDAYDSKLKGFGSIPIGGLMGYSFAEHVWLDT